MNYLKKLIKLGVIIGVILALSLPATVLAEGNQEPEVETAANASDPGGGGGY
jgi:hypothetical protein